MLSLNIIKSGVGLITKYPEENFTGKEKCEASLAFIRRSMQNSQDVCCCQGSKEEQALYDQIAQVIEKYKGTDGALIMVLHEAQEIYGYLPMELQQFIADGMEIPLSDVSGVVSFYSFFTPNKRGKHTIRVCQGTACYVRGGKKLVDAIHENLGVETNGTTEDGQFTFEIARCIGACGLAPAVMIDDDVYKQVTPAKLPGILALYQDDQEEAAEEEEGGEEA